MFEEAPRDCVDADDDRGIDLTAGVLRSALAAAVDHAMYWQPPSGEDILAATGSVRVELERIAEHIGSTPHAQWWSTELARADQWIMEWVDPNTQFRNGPAATPTTAETLRDYSARTVKKEVRAASERPADPSAGLSGEWWSFPPTRSTSRSLFDGTPAELWFVEDGTGWKRAVSQRVRIPGGVRVYEIDSAQAWAQLCREFPVEVTAQKRHDWYTTTGRVGRWVIPDWPRVAEDYDGVHLTVCGYLSAAGTAIPVDDATASVIAGWAPGETYWLTDVAAADVDEAQVWVCVTDGEHPEWTAEKPL